MLPAEKDLISKRIKHLEDNETFSSADGLKVSRQLDLCVLVQILFGAGLIFVSLKWCIYGDSFNFLKFCLALWFFSVLTAAQQSELSFGEIRKFSFEYVKGAPEEYLAIRRKFKIYSVVFCAFAHLSLFVYDSICGRIEIFVPVFLMTLSIAIGYFASSVLTLRYVEEALRPRLFKS